MNSSIDQGIKSQTLKKKVEFKNTEKVPKESHKPIIANNFIKTQKDIKPSTVIIDSLLLENINKNIHFETTDMFNSIEQEEFDYFSDSESEENLEQALRNSTERTIINNAISIPLEEIDKIPIASLTKLPEVVDDYFRNFLSRKELLKTLETFQVFFLTI